MLSRASVTKCANNLGVHPSIVVGRIAQDGATPVIQQGQAAALGLAPIDATRYISSTGEVLDLNAPGVSYRNIALSRVDDPPAR